MLKDKNADFVYRDYSKEPLDEVELRDTLGKLGVSPRDVLRKRDASKAGVAVDDGDDALFAAMADNNRLLQRPILVVGDRAVVGRPVENLLELLP